MPYDLYTRIGYICRSNLYQSCGMGASLRWPGAILHNLSTDKCCRHCCVTNKLPYFWRTFLGVCLGIRGLLSDILGSCTYNLASTAVLSPGFEPMPLWYQQHSRALDRKQESGAPESRVDCTVGAVYGTKVWHNSTSTECWTVKPGLTMRQPSRCSWPTKLK